MLRFCFGFPLIFALSACASTPDAPKSLDMPKEQLSARNLAPGECGLFVWKADAEKKFILFSQSQSAQAIWTTPSGEEQVLSVSAQSGTPTEKQYPVQSFSPVNLQLSLRESQGITDGTRYKAGTLTQRSDGEWDRVTPVVGLSTCRAL